MFFPEGQVRVFLYGQPVNMRLSVGSGDFQVCNSKLEYQLFFKYPSTSLLVAEARQDLTAQTCGL